MNVLVFGAAPRRRQRRKVKTIVRSDGDGWMSERSARSAPAAPAETLTLQRAVPRAVVHKKKRTGSRTAGAFRCSGILHGAGCGQQPDYSAGMRSFWPG
ncbi:hypothetical protein [Brachymonas denitrificans]|uniref:hypothetical protein n=1 Tax=Brachymonas denitrificans TaxID=28220 RepID=UPI00321F8F9C